MATGRPVRFRVTFAKTEAMRFTGHLDVHRAWERTFRRARLPLAYSQGFNPHPRLNIGAALPLGCLSTSDLLDAWLEDPLAAAEVLARLDAAAPPGLEVLEVARVDDGEPALQSRIRAARYEAEILEARGEEFQGQVEALLRADTLPRQRRGKAYDLRPLIENLTWDSARGALRMRLKARPGATGRPEEVLRSLGLDPATKAVRTGLVLADPDDGSLAMGTSEPTPEA